MSGRQQSLFVLFCDGCETEFPPKVEHINSYRTRIDASQQGWTMEPRVKADGKLTSKECDDVCPECAPDWMYHPTKHLPKGPR